MDQITLCHLLEGVIKDLDQASKTIAKCSKILEGIAKEEVDGDTRKDRSTVIG